MKFGILFLILGFLIAGFAIQSGGWLTIFLWPSFNCLTIGIAYLAKLPQLFGKQPNGSLSLTSTIFLPPYFLYLWLVWHTLRLLQTENASDQLNDRLTIGRRLLYSEMPHDIQNVIDLTCEFNEPSQITNQFNYLSFPILDASVPRLPDLNLFLKQFDSMPGKSYIHCAQGHGRTGFIVAAILMHYNPNLSVDAAIEQIRAVRPGLRCNREQMETLRYFAIHNKTANTAA